jgi:PAS domain S-box-containing protein
MKTELPKANNLISNPRAEEFFRQQQTSVYKRTDYLFAFLLPGQWLAGIIAAYFISPYAWSGNQSSLHPHLWAAIFLGGAITSLPLFLVIAHPGAATTRYTVAASQMMMSGLLIHLTGGRIETHFHVFGSLAFLSFYRDWSVLIPATIVTSLDHFLRGWLYPFSIYGILTGAEWRWLEHVCWVLFTDIFLMVSCIQSVSAMRDIARHTAALDASEERYRAVVEQTEEGIALLECETMRVIECNEAFMRLLGCESVEEVKNLTAFDYNTGERWEIGYLPKINSNQKITFGGEKNYRRRDGTLVPVEVNVSLISYDGRQVFCAAVKDITERRRTAEALQNAHDILEQRVVERTAELIQANRDMQVEVNERKHAEAELDKAQKFLRKVIDNDPNLIFVKDEAGRFTLANRAVAKMYGTTTENLIGKSDRDFNKNGEEVHQFFSDDRQVLENLQEKFIYEEQLTDAGGNIHWLQTLKRPIIFNEGDSPHILVIATDLTERKILESQLRQAQKLESIGQIAAGVAHEINTPMQFVSDNTCFIRNAFKDISYALQNYHLLMRAAQSGKINRELIREIDEEISNTDVDYLVSEIPVAIQHSLEGIARISKIVQSMRNFAHPGSAEKSLIDINRAIESTVTIAGSQWKYIADLKTVFDESLSPVPGFLGEFNQVILNLIINATHAIAEVAENGEGNRTGGKGKITITTGKEDHWAEVRITDTGSGIPYEVQNRVFDPFFTTKEVGKGTGQGLAIAHHVIVEKHCGQLSFESTPGQGTTFIIRLPLHNKKVSHPPLSLNA